MYRLRYGLGVISVDSLAHAIAQMEGYNTPGTLAQRNNNPGNLRSGPGQIGTSGGFAVFPSADAGWAALDNQISLNASRGLTLNEFFAGKPGVYPGYAPSADSNDPAHYAAFVASQTGADPTVPISSLLAAPGGSDSIPASTYDYNPSDAIAPAGLSTGAMLGIALAAAGLVAWATG